MILRRPGRKNLRAGVASPHAPHGPLVSVILHNRTQILVFVLAFAVLVAATTRTPELIRKTVRYDINVQAIAMEEIRADIPFQTEDLLATKTKRDEVAARVPDTYRIDDDCVQEQLNRLDERILALSSKHKEVAAAVLDALKASNSHQSDFEVVESAVMQYVERLMDDPVFAGFPDPAALAIWLMPSLESLPQRQFQESPKQEKGDAPPRAVKALSSSDPAALVFKYADELARLARESLRYVLTAGIMPASPQEDVGKRTAMVMREHPVAGQKVSEEMPLAKIPTPKTATDMLGQRLAEEAKALAGKEADRPVDWAKLQSAAFEMAKPFITDTLRFDRVYTEGARESARLAIPPELKEIQPGEVIQRHGERWTPQSRSDVMTYWSKLESAQKPSYHAVARLVAHSILVILALICLMRSALLLTPKGSEAIRAVNLALLIMCMTVLFGRVVSYFEPSGFVVPAASGAILLAILINPRMAVMTSLLTSLMLSLQFGYDWRLLVVTCAMSIAGVFGMYRVRKRSDMTRSALKATVVGMAVMLAITLAMDSFRSEPAVRRIFMVMLNGGACLLIVPGVLSPLERLFRITTDIQLLEFSDLNNEVLSRMAIEIPATYAHSLMLGQLAEAAANAIGANGLLARVCAYYHDIGKLRRPEYFSENQTGMNIHDDLPPRLSARAIASHAMYGAELAREFHLPRPIIDGILEHHGTTLISFFYQQAVQDDKRDDVSEDDFRYPGPKPQSRETAILMVCDAVESGVRSIKNPNEERVREFVDRIIRLRFADRQFDECDITLKELDTIKEVITVRMMAALHTRIAYPDKEPSKSVDNVVPLSGGAS